MTDERRIELTAQTWPSAFEFFPSDIDQEALASPDWEGIYEGLVDFLVEEFEAEIDPAIEIDAGVDSSTAIFLPGTRVFVSLDDFRKAAIERVLALLTTLFLGQPDRPQTVVLIATADLVRSALKKLIRLNEQQIRVAKVVADLVHRNGRACSESEILRETQGEFQEKELRDILSTLEKQEVAETDGLHWRIRV